jgi:hypothetical protein
MLIHHHLHRFQKVLVKVQEKVLAQQAVVLLVVWMVLNQLHFPLDLYQQ